MTGCQRKGVRVIACVSMLAASCLSGQVRADDPDYSRPGPYPVGVRTAVYRDGSRQDAYASGPRTLVTEIWYPARDDARGREATKFIDFFAPHPEAATPFVEHFKGKLEEVTQRFRSVAVRGAPLRDGRYPLLIFSHGNGGVRHQNVVQLDHLASHGYIIASPDHTGNAGVSVLPDKVVPYDRKGRDRSRDDRPKDVSFLIDTLLAEAKDPGSWLHGALDADAIGVLGHSFGGYTCCQAAASDPRVKAILPMTLALSKPVSIPMLVMLGRLDRTVKEAGNLASTAYFMSSTGPRHLLTLKRGGHFSFTDMDAINTAFGDGIGKETNGTETIEFLSAAKTKEIVNAYSVAFFHHYLRRDQRAGEFLRENRYPEEMELREEKGAAGDTLTR